VQNSRKPTERFGSPAFWFCSEKVGAKKHHTEEVPRRNAASPEWETDIHHHQTEEMTQTDKTEIRKECNKCLYFWESSLRC